MNDLNLQNPGDLPLDEPQLVGCRLGDALGAYATCNITSVWCSSRGEEPRRSVIFRRGGGPVDHGAESCLPLAAAYAWAGVIATPLS